MQPLHKTGGFLALDYLLTFKNSLTLALFSSLYSPKENRTDFLEVMFTTVEQTRIST